MLCNYTIVIKRFYVLEMYSVYILVIRELYKGSVEKLFVMIYKKLYYIYFNENKMAIIFDRRSGQNK